MSISMSEVIFGAWPRSHALWSPSCRPASAPTARDIKGCQARPLRTVFLSFTRICKGGCPPTEPLRSRCLLAVRLKACAFFDGRQNGVYILISSLSTMQRLTGGVGLAPSVQRGQSTGAAQPVLRQQAAALGAERAASRRSRRPNLAAAAGRGSSASPGGGSSGSGSSGGGGFEPHGVPHRHVEYMLNAVSNGAAEQAGAEYGEVSLPAGLLWLSSVRAFCQWLLTAASAQHWHG